VEELSGLAVSRRRPGVLWAHEDSGADPVLLALRADGTLLGEVVVDGADAIDWEDMAARGGQLYLGDIGDNAGTRGDVTVYRVPEPDPRAERTAPATAYRLRYPDGAHNAETLLADPRSDALAIVTKEDDGRSGVYVAVHPSPSATTTLRRVATLRLGIGGLATAGDVSANGRVIAVRTYTALVAWRRRGGETLGAAMRRAPCVGRVSLAREGQGESLALAGDGRAFYTAPEGERPIIRRYSAASD
jgi:hypothetical protein